MKKEKEQSEAGMNLAKVVVGPEVDVAAATKEALEVNVVAATAYKDDVDAKFATLLAMI